MVRLTIVSFQKHSATLLADAERDYVQRLSRQARVALVEVRQWDDARGLPQRLLDAGWPIGLCIDGRQFSSHGLAARLQELLNQGQSHLVLALGGPDGLPAQALAQVRERWSLSQLTFGHQLARLVLLESLYRSFDLLRGGPYHR